MGFCLNSTRSGRAMFCQNFSGVSFPSRSINVIVRPPVSVAVDVLSKRPSPISDVISSGADIAEEMTWVVPAGAVELVVAVPGGMSTSADTEDAVSRFSSDAVELVVAVPIVGTTDGRFEKLMRGHYRLMDRRGDSTVKRGIELFPT